jgi:hypothetical protein
MSPGHVTAAGIDHTLRAGAWNVSLNRGYTVAFNPDVRLHWFVAGLSTVPPVNKRSNVSAIF